MKGESLQYRRNAALQALVAVLVLVLVTIPVDGDQIPALEEDVFSFVNGLPGWLYRPLWPFMQMGNLIALPIAAGAALIFLRNWKVFLALLVAIECKLFLGSIVKDNVVRHRPAALLDDVVARDDTGLGLAFVSGHIVVAVAIALILSPWVGRGWRIFLWSCAGIVMFGRVYVGAHLPLDVVGGAALGWFLGSTLNALIGPPQRQPSARGQRAVFRPTAETPL